MYNNVVANEVLGSKTKEDATVLAKLWEDYAEKYNTLSSLMQQSGLNPKLLRDVVDAKIKFYKMQRYIYEKAVS